MAQITPQPGAAAQVPTGGTSLIAVTAIPSGIGGGIIKNPLTAADQGIVGSAEPLLIDATGPCSLVGNGTTFALAPGESWQIIPGQVSSTWVNAATSGHKFSVIWWLPSS